MKIKYEYGICSKCGFPKLITQKSLYLCTSCNRKRLAKKAYSRLKEKIRQGKVSDKDRVRRFFKKYWKKHLPHVCFETGQPLFVYHGWHLHHLLPQEDFPQYALNEDNIVYLSLSLHRLWHDLTDEKRQHQMPKTWAAYNKIKKKYNVT